MAEAILRYLTIRDRRLTEASPVFFGWFVVFAATIGMAMTIPGQTAGLSLFIDAFIADLGISRATISLTYTLATVAGAVALPYVGRQIDRFGPRRAVLVIALLFGLACWYMGTVGGLVTLAIGFVLMRSLGQGSLSLVSVHAVNLWFIRRRGVAVGIMGTGVALATAFFPLIVERLIGSMGWRDAFFVIGAAVLAVMLPVGTLLFRPHPERFGLRPDGVRADEGVGETEVEEAVYTPVQARRSALFWIVALGGVAMSGLGTGLIFHHFSILAQNGLERSVAALMFVPLGILSATANLGAGFLLDRMEPRRVLGFTQLALATLLLTVPFVNSIAAVWTYGIAFGLLQGTMSTINGSAYGHYFGRTHLGAIKGFANTLLVGGSAIGPLLYGAGFSILGSYNGVIMASAGIPLAIGAAALVRRG